MRREVSMDTPIVSPMAHADGSMTFDWIFFAIVAIPMVFAVWELIKNNTIIRELAAKQR